MATANQATLDAANKLNRAVFRSELELAGEGPVIEATCLRTSAKAKTVEYDFLDDFGEMREWIGERRFSDMKAFSFTIPNVKYESSFALDRVDAETDSLGLYTPRVRGFVGAYNRLRRTKIAALLTGGATSGNNSYDGVSFFNTAHVHDGGGATQDNYDTSTALTGANFDAAVKKMELLTDHRGNPMGITPTVLIVGPALRAKARNLFGVATDFAASGGGSSLSNAGDNPYYGQVRVIIESYLGSSTSWFLADDSHTLKPFVLQDADPLELQTSLSVNDHFVQHNDAFFYGSRARFGVGYAFWQLMYRADE